jgi:hypothetical protein
LDSDDRKHHQCNDFFAADEQSNQVTGRINTNHDDYPAPVNSTTSFSLCLPYACCVVVSDASVITQKSVLCGSRENQAKS